MVQTVETQALVSLRRIQTGVTRKNISRVECTLPIKIAQYLLNKKRADLAELETKYQVEIQITPVSDLPPSQSRIDFI